MGSVFDRGNSIVVKYKDINGNWKKILYVKAYNNLGRVRRVEGRVDEAKSLFETALELDPGNTVARRELDGFPPSPEQGQ